jgi:hypothetical protein
MLSRLIGAVIILAGSAVFALAQTATRVETFQAWSVYTYAGAEGRVCYTASRAEATLPQGVNRDPEYFMISNWPDRTAANEVSIIMGYPLEVNSTVTVTIDTEVFEFFVGGDAAWIRDLALEEQLVVAMRRGVTMVVRGRSQRGTDTTDTYSLRGVTLALERAALACQ